MISSKNTNLHKAKNDKNDEFYTRYEDIEKEIEVYFKYDNNVFKDKIILLPCDDYRWSNFTKYFIDNFERYGLKKLISTHYAKDGDIAYKFVYDGLNKSIEPLKGNGDFRSEEVTKLRDECDVIVTNPPFSLARPFIAWIMEADKKFLIIINSNAITYKEVFPLLKNNDIWLGCHTVKEFKKPNGEYQKFGNICWFTNLDHDKRHEKLSLMTMADNLKYNKKLIKKLKNDYGTETYPKYDNYDAIEVPYTDAIPSDYCESWGVNEEVWSKLIQKDWEVVRESVEEGIKTKWIIPAEGTDLRTKLSNQEEGYKEEIEQQLEAEYCTGALGVPISYLDKHNPDEFEIIDANEIKNNDSAPIKKHGLIKDKDGSITINKNTESAQDYLTLKKNYPRKSVSQSAKIVYARIVIKRKN